jgi:hypothetical protein
LFFFFKKINLFLKEMKKDSFFFLKQSKFFDLLLNKNFLFFFLKLFSFLFPEFIWIFLFY